MTREEVKELVDYLNAQSLFGTVVTWNGMGFDWPVLAEESGQPDTCRELARNHVDMMYHLFCTKGFPLGLNSAAAGMNVGAKTEGMSGATAPEMWTDGKRQEVIDYCIQDTKLTLDLANACQADHGLNLDRQIRQNQPPPTTQRMANRRKRKAHPPNPTPHG